VRSAEAARHPATRWLALVALAAATWLPIAGLHAIVAAPVAGTIATGEFHAGAVARPPGDAGPWTPVALPDDWRATRPSVREGWYRLRFRADGAERLGVFLPSVGMNAAVYVNGERIGSGGAFTPSPARNVNRALLFAIPAHVLVAGDNVLALRVAADLPGRGFLPAPAVGSLATLARAHAQSTFVRRTLLWTLVVFRLVVAVFTAAIFVMWRRQAYYGWFAVSVVAWVVAEANLLVVDPPIGLAAWYWLFNVAIGWWGISAVRMVLSFIGVSRPRSERALMLAGVAGSLGLAVLAATGSPHFDPLAVNLWLVLAFGASLTLVRSVWERLRRYPDAIELNVVFVVAFSVIGCVLFDLTVQLGLQPRGGLSVPPYASFLAVVGMGWVLVRRFVGALGEAQALAATLEERVRAERAEVDASWRRILATERARVLSAERERILRDTDEGLGAQLVATLALLERPESGAAAITRGVRAALDDLRLVVDSLDPQEGDVLVMLGTVRARLQGRFDAAGIRVEWLVTDLPALPDLTPHRVLQILRIVHAVFSGALAGQGGTLRVATRATATDAVIEMAMIGAAAPTADLERLRARARDAGGTLEADWTADSTVVRLALPLGAPAVPPALAASPIRGIAALEGIG
jgi:hypothetical protein